MLKKLKLLLSLRAWIRSGQLKAGGLLGILGAIQVWLGTDDGMGIIEWVSVAIGLMGSTVIGVFTSAIGLVMLILRAKTEWSLAEKVAEVDKDPAKVAAVEKITKS